MWEPRLIPAGLTITAAMLTLAGQAAQAATGPIEEIVVTAQKRETALQDTPIAISAFGEDQIARDHIEDFQDIAAHIPSLTYGSLARYTALYMRGVGTDLTGPSAETAVAVYADGVYRGAQYLQEVPTFDLERIEVLRGPQGTLYGRNATGGAVNFITKAPSEEPEFNASILAGDYDRRKVDLGVAGQLVPGVLSGRMSFVYDDREGYRKNRIRNDREDAAELRGVKGALYWAPVEHLEIVLRADHTELEDSKGVRQLLGAIPGSGTGLMASNFGGVLTDADSPLWASRDFGGLSPAEFYGLEFPVADPRALDVDPDELVSYTNDPYSTDVEQKGLSATLTWSGDTLTAKLIGSFRKDEVRLNSFDSDGTDISLLNATDSYQENDSKSFELNLSGTAWQERVDWLVGVYYFDDTDEAGYFYQLDAAQLFFEGFLGIVVLGGDPLPSGALAAFGQPRMKNGQRVPFPFLDFVTLQERKSRAVYGQTTITIAPDMRLTLGARYTEDDKKVSRSNHSNIGANCTAARFSEDWNETTGTLIFDYRLTESTMAYASWSRGFKAGGFNQGSCTDPAFDPEIIDAYEVGLKSRFADGRAVFNAAAFSYDYDDIQINRWINLSSAIANAAKADIHGIELDIIVVAGGGFSFDAAVTWLDTEYGGRSFFRDPIVPSPNVLVDGNRVLRTPEWKYHLGAEYTLEARSGRYALRLDTTYSGNYHFDVFEASLPNQQDVEQPSYQISNARISWTSLDNRYEVQAFVENIEDELYAEVRQPSGTVGAVLGGFSAPRTYGIRFSVRLGGG